MASSKAWQGESAAILRSPFLLGNVSILFMLRILQRYGETGFVAFIVENEKMKRDAE